VFPVIVGSIIVGLVSIVIGWHALWVTLLLAIALLLLLIGAQACCFLLLGKERCILRLRMLESDFGRNAGWYVEIAGRRVAELTDPQFFDMFWVSYRVDLLTDDAEECSCILNDLNWWDQKELTFRNREFDTIAKNAFAGGSQPDPNRRIMRGLYIDMDPPNLFEELLLLVRRKTLRKPAP